jgi:glycosyltransferase involved in cell wall biosynthesis
VSKKRLNVLVSAFAFSPFHGSEAGVGWNIVSRLAGFHNVTVLYGEDVACTPAKENIDRGFNEKLIPAGLTPIYVPCEPSVAQRVLKKIFEATGFKPFWFLYYYSFYKRWQKAAFAVAQELHQREKFDLTHQLTYITYREPGYLWKLPVPFFWGPINGADNIPPAYFGMMGPGELIQSALRDGINFFQRFGWGRVRRAARKASKIWAVSKADRRMVAGWGRKADMMPVTGTFLSDQARVRMYNGDQPLKLIWSGVHEARKSLPLLLHALAELNRPNDVILTILGSGLETFRWKALAKKMGVDGCIEWAGRLSLEDSIHKMNEGDCFVLTSIREGTPTVVMESFSLGMPVICHDACGMSAVVDNQCGILIPLRSPKESIQSLIRILSRILSRDIELELLSRGALKKAQHETWAAHVQEMIRGYASSGTEKEGR